MSGLRQASAEAELKPLAELLDDIHRRIAGGATVPPLLFCVCVVLPSPLRPAGRHAQARRSWRQLLPLRPTQYALPLLLL